MNRRIELSLYYILLSAIVVFSAWHYLPCFYSLFNSDHAVHVLMSKDFQLPRDYYYWGQNRLGSLLPMISYAINSVLKIHPVYVCSVVHYLFLLVPFLLIARYIRNIWLRLGFLCLIFLPFNSYNALLYIGHPYSQQFFCATLFVLAFMKAQQLMLQQGSLSTRKGILQVLLYLFIAILFFVLGVWVSEFGAILILIPLILFLSRLRAYKAALSGKQALLISMYCLVLLVAGYAWFRHTKDVSVVDAQYNKTFITDSKSIRQEYDFMLQKIKASFDYSNPDTRFDNTIYLVFFLTLLILFIRRKEIRAALPNRLPLALLITSIVSSVVLFFSFWNLRSEFCPRYYIPVYIMVSLALILYFDRIQNRLLSVLFFLAVLFHCCTYTYMSLIRYHIPSPFEKYADFKTLPRGTLIGDYWESYLIQAVAIDSLNSINFDNNPVVRIYEWRQIPLSEKRFYFLNNETAKSHGLKDTITQFSIRFAFTGKKYVFPAAEVLEYKKIN